MDRSKFIANMMASSLGAAITMPICGFLIESLGWASVFYVTGNIPRKSNISIVNKKYSSKKLNLHNFYGLDLFSYVK